MLRLGVNIDHVATLREARYRGRDRGEPDPVSAARVCEAAGAHGITAHLREDRRHIQEADVWGLRAAIRTRFNLEMANTPAILDLVLKLKPEMVCLVPERRQEITTEGGLEVAGQWTALAETRRRLNAAGIAVSLFISPDADQVTAAARVGSQSVELNTGAFAEQFNDPVRGPVQIARLTAAARQAHDLGLQVNAGHGLNYQNLERLWAVPFLEELNIGHTIISKAITVGLTAAVQEMLILMARYPGARPGESHDPGRGH